MKYLKLFEKFNDDSDSDDEPLSRAEEIFGKDTRLEKQFSKIVVSGLSSDSEARYWTAFNALKIELQELIDKKDPLYKEMMHRIVEGEDPTEVINDIFSKVGNSTSESERLLNKLNNYKKN